MPITTSAEETRRLARELTRGLYEPTCISLIGKLGAGKTVFVKGIAEGLGIKDVIQSPSFVMMRSYSGRMKLYHIDLYRVTSREELFPFEDYLLKDGVSAIEWSDRAKDILPKERIEVKIDIKGRDKRRIVIYDYRN
ncbi:MAG: tRNA (adenosine(37)-N6)-threonylcarbamoyltransferase complex ATPase subunit type 1 TsaE [candidate division WOR-3 bacterium]|nr:tRNA (adenosine(37)-N6)-threonylcarbamoyltransferase complex ATPase subunit type 1 TsaE [candidate division WOR-3 bacterium]